MDLTCPKCHGAMRQYERNSVLVDQCGDCRGVFLDRGELEKLIDAEAHWADTAAAGRPPAPQQQQHTYPAQDPRSQGYAVQGYRNQYYRNHKKKSFLEELLG